MRLTRIALVILCSIATGTAAAAQTAATAAVPALEAVLRPGLTVWVTDTTGREARARVVNVSGGVLTIADGIDTRRIATTDVVRVRARRTDSVLNGALIGAATAVATGLVLCNLTEPWENCRDDVGPIVRIGAVGAGIGIGIDALIRGRKVIYEAPRAPPLVLVVPFVTRRVAGLRLSVRF